MTRWRPILGVVLASTRLLAWISFGVVAGIILTSPTQQFAKWILILIAGVTGFGGLWLFWGLESSINFLRRGYRVREIKPRAYIFHWPLGHRNCVFEEVGINGEIQTLPFVRVVLAGGYPAPSEILLPSQMEWDHSVPPWARGRRAEVVACMSEFFGKSDTNTRFVDIA